MRVVEFTWRPDDVESEGRPVASNLLLLSRTAVALTFTGIGATGLTSYVDEGVVTGFAQRNLLVFYLIVPLALMFPKHNNRGWFTRAKVLSLIPF